MKIIKLVNILFILLLLHGCKHTNSKEPIDSNLDTNDIITDNEYTTALANADGIWCFEKASLYGGFKPEKENYYTKENLDSIYRNICFEISDYLISYSNGCSAGLSIEKVDISTFFAGKLLDSFDAENPSDREIRSFYKREFGIEMKDSIVIFNISSCEYPFNRLLVFPNKILIVEYGAYNFSFTKAEKDKSLM